MDIYSIPNHRERIAHFHQLPDHERADLVLTTTSADDLTLLEYRFIMRLPRQPELRTALYKCARRNALHRHSLTSTEPAPDRETPLPAAELRRIA